MFKRASKPLPRSTRRTPDAPFLVEPLSTARGEGSPAEILRALSGLAESFNSARAQMDHWWWQQCDYLLECCGDAIDGAPAARAEARASPAIRPSAGGARIGAHRFVQTPPVALQPIIPRAHGVTGPEIVRQVAQVRVNLGHYLTRVAAQERRQLATVADSIFILNE